MVGAPPYALLGEAISAIWGARRAIRSNTPAHKLGTVIGILNGLSRQFEESDQGDFFRISGAFDSCAHMIDTLQHDTEAAYTQSGSPDIEQLGYAIEGALLRLDDAEDELRVWWVRLMSQRPAPIEVQPISEGPLGQSLERIHGIGPDPQLMQVMKEYDLLYAKQGDLQVNDELLTATEPIKADRDKIRLIPHFSDMVEVE